MSTEDLNQTMTNGISSKTGCVSFLLFRNGEKKESNNCYRTNWRDSHMILWHVSYRAYLIWKKLHLGVATHHVPSWVLANYY